MITVEGLTYTYPGAPAPTLRGLDFEVGDGKIFGFLGPSGAGKSTTQNVLIGLLEGFEGRVEVLGRRLEAWGRDYYAHVGVSFELPNHYLQLTARENLDYFRALYDAPTDTPAEALARVGLEAHLDRRVGDFSKGMKNRLTLARSLLHRPKLWFLDEPTAGLDPVNAVAVRELIRARQREGVTVVLTTHDMHVASALCDRVAFLVDGRIVECDRPEALERRFGRREVDVRFGAADAPSRATFDLDALAEARELFRILREEPVLSIHSQETTLEDVFVQVTGRRLVDGASAAQRAGGAS
jgi:fluoroquinolone transport system ATP-binding protein